jgi:hypothetical protein
MPTHQDVQLARFEDGAFLITLTPPIPIGGWDARFDIMKRFNSDEPLYTALSASGYGAGQSGITITSSGEGRLTVRIPGVALSGQTDKINFCYTLQRYTSGCRVLASQGFLTLQAGGPANSGM